jgi:hypothetical protein
MSIAIVRSCVLLSCLLVPASCTRPEAVEFQRAASEVIVLFLE